MGVVAVKPLVSGGAERKKHPAEAGVLSDI
jgi:hypothetical protein